MSQLHTPHHKSRVSFINGVFHTSHGMFHQCSMFLSFFHTWIFSYSLFIFTSHYWFLSRRFFTTNFSFVYSFICTLLLLLFFFYVSFFMSDFHVIIHRILNVLFSFPLWFFFSFMIFLIHDIPPHVFTRFIQFYINFSHVGHYLLRISLSPYSRDMLKRTLTILIPCCNHTIMWNVDD